MAGLPQGPYILEYGIVVGGLSHSFEVNCDTLGTAVIGSDPDDIQMAARSEAATVTLQAGADALWTAYRRLLTTQHLCSTFTLWKAQATTTKRIFVSGGVLTTPNGMSAGAYKPAQQLTITLRSGTGRIGRIVAMEGPDGGNERHPINPADTGTDYNIFAAYALSANSIICARDRSFFVQGMNATFGQNEVTYRERYRG